MYDINNYTEKINYKYTCYGISFLYYFLKLIRFLHLNQKKKTNGRNDTLSGNFYKYFV